jgi:hypothetical protein
VQLPDVSGERAERVEEIAHDTATPAQLLLEEDRKGVGNSGPAEGVVVDVGAVAAQEGLVGEEAVFALVDGDAEPVAGANLGLDLQQQLPADGEETAANAADAAGPVFGDLVELEGRVVKDGLDGGDDAVVGVAHANAAADGTNLRLREAGGELADGVGVEDAVGVDGEDDFGCGVLECIADGAGLAAVDGVAAGADADVGEVALGLENPLVAVVDGAVVLGDDLEEFGGVVAAADALDGLVDGLAFVVTGKENADGREPGVVLADGCAAGGPLEDQAHEVLDDGDQQAEKHHQP